jgi:hypothetical protein
MHNEQEKKTMNRYKVTSYDSDGQKVRVREFYHEGMALEHIIHCGNMGWKVTVSVKSDCSTEDTREQLIDWRPTVPA